ncbi:MAG TPA: hypothetical protein VGO00_13040 [Kofleriaceae bacterium]|nr:hypothetical protein [Kofleriaceae bacterium]
MKGALAGLGVGLAIALWMFACGGPHPPHDCSRGSECWQETTRAEILSSWTEIRQWRHEAHMDLDPKVSDVMQLRSKTVEQVKPLCAVGHTEPPACNDVCSLGHDICDNAEHICKLADELGKEDDFAQQKCSSAKASCREAEQRCCDCSSATRDESK